MKICWALVILTLSVFTIKSLLPDGMTVDDSGRVKGSCSDCQNWGCRCKADGNCDCSSQNEILNSKSVTICPPGCYYYGSTCICPKYCTDDESCPDNTKCVRGICQAPYLGEAVKPNDSVLADDEKRVRCRFGCDYYPGIGCVC
jgi:hypothetical protein